MLKNVKDTYGNLLVGEYDGNYGVHIRDGVLYLHPNDLYYKMDIEEAKGRFLVDEKGKRIINLYEKADETTFIHEMGHFLLADLEELAQTNDSDKKDLDTVNLWAKWHGEGEARRKYKGLPFYEEFQAIEEGIISAVSSGNVEQEMILKEQWRQERFARGFELYVMGDENHKSFTKAVRKVFKKLSKTMSHVYHAVKHTGAEPSKEVADVMQRLLNRNPSLRPGQNQT